jgi:DNA-binding transcriptional LysR family regulator
LALYLSLADVIYDPETLTESTLWLWFAVTLPTAISVLTSFFLETYPELQIELAVRDEVGDLISDGFDAAVRFGPPQPYALLVRRLLQVRMLTCAAPAFLQHYGKPRTPRDLETKRLPCLLYRDPITGEPYLKPPLLIYGAFMLSSTLLAWLLLYL